MSSMKRRQFLETVTGTTIGVVFGEYLISTTKEISSSGLTLAQVSRVPPRPMYRIRIHAIVTGRSEFTALDVQSLLNETNKIYAPAGIQFIFDRRTDLDIEPGPLSDDKNVERTTRALRYPGKLVIYFRGTDGDGGFSGGDGEFAAMQQVSDSYTGRLLAHELGHYFNLVHIFAPDMTIEKARVELKRRIQQQPEAQTALANRQLISQDVLNRGNQYLYEILDGDSAYVEDTGPSFQGYGAEAPPELGKRQCDANFTVPITVIFDNGQSYTYNIQPNRTNIMGYYFACSNIPQQFSPGQIRVIREFLEKGSRSHLIGPVLHWDKWADVQGDGRTDAAPAAATPSNLLHAFVKGLDKRIYYNKSLDGQTFRGWVEVQGDGRTDAAPATVAVGNLLYAFIKGLDNRIYYNTSLNSQSSMRWIEVQGDGRTDAAPAATALVNLLYVFIKGLDNRIYYNTSLNSQSSMRWVEVQGDGRTDAAPAVVALDQLYVFIKGLDNRIYYNKSLDGQTFRGWVEVQGDGRTDAAPAVVAFGPRFYVFIKGLDNRIYCNVAIIGQPFRGWREIPGDGITDAAPTVAALKNSLHIFVKGPTGRIFHNSAEFI